MLRLEVRAVRWLLLVLAVSGLSGSAAVVDRACAPPALRPAFVGNPLDAAKEAFADATKKLEASFVNLMDRFSAGGERKAVEHAVTKTQVSAPADEKTGGVAIKQGNLNVSEKSRKAKEAVEKYGLTEEDLKSIGKAFKVFDGNASGSISLEELERTMAALGHKHTADEIKQMLWQIDADGSDEIEYDEFIQMMAPKIAASRNAK